MQRAACNIGWRNMAALVVAALLPMLAVGNSIVDIIDWKTVDVEQAAEGSAVDSDVPDSSKWQQTSISNITEDASGRSVDLLAGTWDAARWTEVDFWASDITNSPFNHEMYLADLASKDWIGVSVYRDVANQELYGLNEFKLMVPEPSEVLLLAMAFVVAGLA